MRPKISSILCRIKAYYGHNKFIVKEDKTCSFNRITNGTILYTLMRAIPYNDKFYPLNQSNYVGTNFSCRDNST